MKQRLWFVSIEMFHWKIKNLALCIFPSHKIIILNLPTLLETLICMIVRWEVCIPARAICLFKLSSKSCFVSTQNRCHMDM
jgi:hypothetical protein